MHSPPSLLFRLSPVRLRAGPGPTLCNPVSTTNSDGPFRTKKFKLPKIPHDYNNHLPTADVARLVGQAELYLFNPQTPFRDSAWPDFLQRCSESCHLFKPMEVAIILRTIDERQADPQNLIISRILSSQLQTHQHIKIPGPAIITFFDIYSTRLPLAQPMLAMLSKKLPESMDELSAMDILKVLNCLKNAEIKDLSTCQKVSRKIMAGIPKMSYKGLCETSSIFGFHEYRNLELYQMIVNRLRNFSPEHMKSQPFLLAKLFNGFFQNSLDPFPLVKHLGTNPPLPKPMEVKLSKELQAHGY